MCKHCGCSDDATPTVTDLQSGQTVSVTAGSAHDHPHPHPDGYDHSHAHGNGDSHDHSHHPSGHARPKGTTFRLDLEILAKNKLLAERNRGWFAERNILALNLVSSPGAGKTTLLECTLRDLANELSLQVIEGDQATLNDARRIQASGCKVVQINTGVGCHLDAAMLARSLQMLDPPADSVVMIENVGNLVCPALFDLGERAKVLVCSVTDGDDKPIKYPHMFGASSLLLLNKIDLLPHVRFDRNRFGDYVRQVNPGLTVLELSATTGAGLEDWYTWLRNQHARREGTRKNLQPTTRRMSL
jgi:hydrogenase nickel incorporation protein HypB